METDVQRSTSTGEQMFWTIYDYFHYFYNKSMLWCFSGGGAQFTSLHVG